MDIDLSTKPLYNQWYSVDVYDGAMSSFMFIRQERKVLMVLFHWIWDMNCIIEIDEPGMFTTNIMDNPLFEEPTNVLSELRDTEYNRRILEYISEAEYGYFHALHKDDIILGEAINYIEVV